MTITFAIVGVDSPLKSISGRPDFIIVLLNQSLRFVTHTSLFPIKNVWSLESISYAYEGVIIIKDCR